MSTPCSVSHSSGCYETDHCHQSQSDVDVRPHLAAGGDAQPVDDEPGQAAAPHRGRPGDEGRDVARLGPRPVLQSLLRPWRLLHLDTGIVGSQLDLDW